MDRIDFLRKVGRYILFMLLAGIILLLGNRIVSGSSCSSCPGKGLCAGEADCSKYLPDKYGRA